MYLKKNKTRSGKIHLSIVDTFYDKERGHSRTKTFKSIGYLDELKKEYDDPIAFFTKYAEDLNAQKKEQRTPMIMEFKHNDLIDLNAVYTKNFGYAILSDIYHELGIHSFLKNRQRHSKESYDANTIMKMLVFQDLLPLLPRKNLTKKEVVSLKKTIILWMMFIDA